MQKGKKYVASDGYEYFMCPFTEFKVTQGENVGTHLGTRAVDFASGTAGYRAPYYAPATVVCVMTVPSSGQAMWRTVNKVHCPNGYFGYVTFVTVHDDSFDAYVGLQVPQGNQLGNMGTRGNATGVHCHLELIQASMSSANWHQNSYGVWTFNGTESYVDDTFYVDDTNIIYGGYGNWRKTGSGSSGYKESDLIAETGVATMTVDNVQARLNSPTGSVVHKYNAGDKITYSWKWVGNGHRYIVWQEGSNKIFLAVSNSETHGIEPWATFAPVEEEKPSGYDESQLIQERGLAKFTRDDIIIRKDKPDGEDTGLRFMSGSTQEYTEKWVGNGHRYISWVEDGTRYFCAVSGSETRGEDSWATFSTVETGQNPESPSDTEPAFPESVVLHGIDVSEHNSSDIDFTQFDYVILRSNWWTTTDKKFKEFADKLEELGIPYGVYCYDYAGDEESALEQAKYTYELIKDRDIKMGVWMDMEDADGWKNKNGYLTKEHCSMICKVFCDFFKEKGYYTGVYSTKWWFENYCPTDYPKWVANWGTNDGTCQSDFSDYGVMHQYTSYGGLDKNVSYHDVEFFKSNPIEEPTDKPTEPTEEEKPTEEPNTTSEEEKPSDKPQEPTEDTNTTVHAIADFFKAVIDAVVNFIKNIFK
ncbi:GH25 family lysozyme [Faecalicoccus sp.]|uniref:GH25 family lysozyme n=1 Tax=Faecalicoccus sp. TaxID=1971758 RepID=UPI002A83FAD8|nr:GH25 family lysozyme [Faecalicoccus sp.]MDY5109720.1 GH25 family lysozyme [Faecalicoccus sp.]